MYQSTTVLLLLGAAGSTSSTAASQYQSVKGNPRWSTDVIRVEDILATFELKNDVFPFIAWLT